jgi:pyridoxamine 5'-phosphate oxidase
VRLVETAEADAYWVTRPRLSQLGAWASLQSGYLENRVVLESRLAEYESKFAGQDVPRPPYWSGYRLAPDMIEFWSARPGRLHERVRYLREEQGWRKQLIYP